MRKNVKYLYTGLLCISFLISSPLIVSQVLKGTPDAKVSKAYAKYEESTEIMTESVAEETESSEITESESEIETESETEPDTRERTKAGLIFVESDQSYFDDALFIGDSRMEDLRDYGTLDNADYLCAVGLSTYKVTGGKYVEGETLAGKFYDRDYSKIYIMLGLNECADSAESFRINMNELLDEVREGAPDALIYLMSNLHVSWESSVENPSESNERLNIINQAIEEMTDGENIIYLDINPLFDDEDGCLPADASGDGVHPYATYYPEWSEWLCQHTITEKSYESAPLPEIDFGQAVEALKQGSHLSRKHWGDEVWIELSKSDEIQMRTSDGRIIPWTVSQEDMLAEDWISLSGNGDAS